MGSRFATARAQRAARNSKIKPPPATPAPPGGVDPSILEQFARVKAEIDRRRYLVDPVAWVTEVLGETLWSKQRQIFESVRDNRLTSVPSAHGVGKSYVAARIACWWIATHPPGTAFVITTATTWKQVEVVLWRELRRAHIKGKLLGRTNRTEWLMPIHGKEGAEEQVAFGHRPADTDPTAFQGVHAPYVLVIFDEAGGIPKLLWESADSLISNEDSRFLAIGNPDDPLGEFAEVSKPGSGWTTIHISALDTPNFTGEEVPELVRKQLTSKVWVEEKKRRWGETNPMYVARVLGEFPEFSSDGLIPMHWIRAAQQRTLDRGLPVELGVDVGGGSDKNIIAGRWGPVVRVLHEDREPDTMVTAGKVIRYLNSTGAHTAKVDYIGIGRGAVDRLKEQKKPVEGVQVGMAPKDSGYLNIRAEGYWKLRELFQSGDIDIDPNDDDLAAQLVDLRYETTSAGKIKIESKDSMKARGKASPDRADAVMLAMLDTTSKKKKATWGRRRQQ